MNVADAAKHIAWTISKSPKAYAEYREVLDTLRTGLVNAELRYRELQKEPNE